MENTKGYIYILTNPSFPEWIKIGYSDNVESRLKVLNDSPSIPFSFQIYATFEVAYRLADKDVHEIIDEMNPSLRSVERKDGKVIRKREFYNMKPEDAFLMLSRIARINGANPPKLYEQTAKDIKEERMAENARKVYHHFDTINFYSSLTNKNYYTSMGENGVLVLKEVDTNVEVPNYANPSKKQIVRQALIDLGEDADNTKTLYQLAHILIRAIKYSDLK